MYVKSSAYRVTLFSEKCASVFAIQRVAPAYCLLESNLDPFFFSQNYIKVVVVAGSFLHFVQGTHRVQVYFLFIKLRSGIKSRSSWQRGES